MPSNPKVSVLIPTYNYGHFLAETIESVLTQTFEDFELIICDNCSTDNTEAIVGNYLSDSRVKYIKNESNIGLAGNWNKCLSLAKGDYIKFLCADDKFHPELLEKFVGVMEQHSNVILVTSYSELFGQLNKQRKQPYTGLVEGSFARKSILIEGGKNWFGEPTTVMFRRSGLVVGNFDTRLKAFLDLEFYLRLFTLGDCYVIPETLSYFRLHDGMETAHLRNLKFERTFEAYLFMKVIRGQKLHKAEEMQPVIDGSIKVRAERCAAVMYKVLPHMQKPLYRSFFKRAFKIGYKEGVLFSPLFGLVKGKRKLAGK